MPTPEAPPFMPLPVSGRDLAFPTSVAKHLPPWDSIPDEFKGLSGKWNQLVTDWFFLGIKLVKVDPKPGIDAEAALRHIKYCLGSFEPKHEHKEAGVAYLLSLWFEDIQYEVAKKESK